MPCATTGVISQTCRLKLNRSHWASRERHRILAGSPPFRNRLYPSEEGKVLAFPDAAFCQNPRVIHAKPAAFSSPERHQILREPQVVNCKDRQPKCPRFKRPPPRRAVGMSMVERPPPFIERHGIQRSVKVAGHNGTRLVSGSSENLC